MKSGLYPLRRSRFKSKWSGRGRVTGVDVADDMSMSRMGANLPDRGLYGLVTADRPPSIILMLLLTSDWIEKTVEDSGGKEERKKGGKEETRDWPLLTRLNSIGILYLHLHLHHHLHHLHLHLHLHLPYARRPPLLL